MTRHDDLIDLIDFYMPRTLIEIGTYDGINAGRMLKAARKHHPNPSYIGYDLFEDATPEINDKEFNLKGTKSEEKARRSINKICPGIDFKLIKGDTKQTLKHAVADFVFIDGGHSIETIAHDYNALKDSEVIVLDDYYEPDKQGLCPDIIKFGCNILVDSLICKRTVTKMKQRNPVKGGGWNSLVVIT
jgi:hypothetical protein